VAEACGLIGGLVTLALLFKLFFSDLSEFGEAIRFWFTPEIVSMFRGEWGQDWWAEVKLGLWLGIGGFVGFGVYAMVANQLAAS